MILTAILRLACYGAFPDKIGRKNQEKAGHYYPKT